MRKFGFKFFSTNHQVAPTLMEESAAFIASKNDMFIELSAICETSEEEFRQIKEQLGDTEVRIHASIAGFDTGNREAEPQNRKILAVAQKAADIFKSKTIVVHPGYGHGQKYLEETARQFKMFRDGRIVVENMPYYDNNGDDMHGTTAEEIAYIMNESGCGFCFDFSHAICAALNLNRDIETQLSSFYALKPAVYHICDGDLNVAQDVHLHLGAGNFPLSHYLNDYTDENAYITLETGKGFERSNDLRIKDYEYLRAVQNVSARGLS